MVVGTLVVLTDVFCSLSIPRGTCVKVSQFRSLPLPSTILPIYYSLIIQSSACVFAELLTTIINLTAYKLDTHCDQNYLFPSLYLPTCFLSTFLSLPVFLFYFSFIYFFLSLPSFHPSFPSIHSPFLPSILPPFLPSFLPSFPPCTE